MTRDKVIVFTGMRYAPMEGTYMSASTVLAEEKVEIGGFSVVNDGCLAVVVRLPEERRTINNRGKTVSANFQMQSNKMMVLGQA